MNGHIQESILGSANIAKLACCAYIARKYLYIQILVRVYFRNLPGRGLAAASERIDISNVSELAASYKAGG